MRPNRTSSAARALGAGLLLLLVLATGAAPARAGEPWVGIALQPGGGGVVVERALPTSPAATGGVQAKDVIRAVNGVTVGSPAAFLAAVGKLAVGAQAVLDVTRQGRPTRLTLKVGSRPDGATLIKLYLLDTVAPDFVAPLVDGSGNASLLPHRGKGVLLFFWATWCDSCKLVLPHLKKLHAAWAQRGLVIVTFGQDKSFDVLRKGAAALKLPFAVAHNPGNRIGLLYKSQNVPALVLVDGKGVIREYLLGSSYSYATLEAAVRRTLGR